MSVVVRRTFKQDLPSDSPSVQLDVTLGFLLTQLEEATKESRRLIHSPEVERALLCATTFAEVVIKEISCSVYYRAIACDVVSTTLHVVTAITDIVTSLHSGNDADQQAYTYLLADFDLLAGALTRAHIALGTATASSNPSLQAYSDEQIGFCAKEVHDIAMGLKDKLKGYASSVFSRISTNPLDRITQLG